MCKSRRRRRIRQIVSGILFFAPIVLGKGRYRIFIRCWSDLIAYLEIFRAGVYDRCFSDGPIQTYCDLGCQSGFSLLRLSSLSGPPQKGLWVDGKPDAVARCNANLRQSALQGFHVAHGVVGIEGWGDEKCVPFYLRPNELESSLQKGADPGIGEKKVMVPVINLDLTWTRLHGPTSCDLLKMDVEGAELNILQTEHLFLKRVRRCVVEWHSPTIDENQTRDLLKTHGFGGFEVLWKGPTSGVLYAKKELK